MQVSPVNNTSNFGHCKGIQCLGQFSKNNPDHIIAINEFLSSNAIKQFGEKYDFIANFKYVPRKTFSDWDCCMYAIDLIPVKNHSTNNLLSRLLNNIFHKTQNTVETKEKVPEIPNLPTDIRIVTAMNYYKTDAYEEFINKLKGLSSRLFFDLNSLLEKKLEKNKLELKQAQEKMTKANEALKNIEASNIPIC